MNLPPIIELAYLGVADAGVPNKERIVLRPTQRINLAQCGIALGFRSKRDRAHLFLDYFFWFGENTVEPPSWIFVYTGKGEYTETKTMQGNERASVYHWGRRRTLFHHEQIIPVILRFDAVLISELRAHSDTMPMLHSDFMKLLSGVSKDPTS